MARRGIAVVGAGMGWTPHALSLKDLADRAEVIGVFSRTAERRTRAAVEHGFPVTDDLPGLVHDPRVSAVMVLTPPAAHLEVVRLAAAAGRHILLEKPLELTTARAVQVVQAARDAGVTLGTVLHYRTRAASRRMAALRREGALGRLVTASCAVPWWRTQAYYDEPGRGTLERDGGGVLITQAIHAIDLFLSLAGPVAEVAAMTGTSILHRMKTEDLACAALRFAGGALGTLYATTAQPPGFAERLDLVFEAATARMDGEGLLLAWRDGRSEQIEVAAAHGGGADPMGYSHFGHRAILADFLDALDEGRAPIAPGAEVLPVHALIDAILRSGASGRAVRVDADDPASHPGSAG
jgi:predicted dehydrogenase